MSRSWAGRRFVALEVGRFALAGAIALVIVGLATAIASRRVGEREAIANARTTTVTKAQGLVAPALTDGVLNGTPSAIGAVDAGRAARRARWFAGTREALERRRHDRLLRRASPRRHALHPRRRREGRLGIGQDRGRGQRSLEAGEPIRAATRQAARGVPAGGDAIGQAAALRGVLPVRLGRRATGSQLWRSFAPIALGALIALELVQIPLAYSLARRLRQRSAERELLLHQALEASDVERRHIASDLHDGVVQDLAGVAYALSAQTRRFDAARPRSRCHRELGVDGPGEHPRACGRSWSTSTRPTSVR